MVKLKKGESYYYAYEPEKFKCIHVGEELSIFTDPKGVKYQFYNEDMYKTKRKGKMVLSQQKDGSWKPAIQEPYYPNIFEKMGHLLGIHQWTYNKPFKCVMCGKLRGK